MSETREYISTPEGLRPLRLVIATGGLAVAVTELSVLPAYAQGATDSEYAPECTYAKEPHWMRDSNRDGKPGPDATEFSCLPRQGCIDIPIIPWAIIDKLTEKGQLSSEQKLILQYESLGGAIGRCRDDSPLTRADFKEVFNNHPWMADMLNDTWVREATAQYLEESIYASFPNSVETRSWDNILGSDTETPEDIPEVGEEAAEDADTPNDTESTQVEDSQPESTPVESDESTDAQPTETPEDIPEVGEEAAEDADTPNDTESTQVEDSQPESTPVESDESTDAQPTETPEDIPEVGEEAAEDADTPNDTESTQVEDSQPESTPVESDESTDAQPTETPEDIPEVGEEAAEDADTPNDTESTQVEDSQPESTPVESDESTDAQPTETPESTPEAIVEVTLVQPPAESLLDDSLPELIGGVAATALTLGALVVYVKRKRSKK